ncbi:uncharacterized protein LOC129596270 isoform X2 [Paramacrobiotus metropolitanus]|uniref:uncharacterized protein LOC129596270 isoform X2 n=1 Tax=Paramacrobiotus metropolitanus TaxID=2943436 RepID=UPI00244606CF|nr:uncharacterized protein LOC129596270 isoform X2 [Paramacrobiotus metropolitanus]
MSDSDENENLEIQEKNKSRKTNKPPTEKTSGKRPARPVKEPSKLKGFAVSVTKAKPANGLVRKQPKVSTKPDFTPMKSLVDMAKSIEARKSITRPVENENGDSGTNSVDVQLHKGVPTKQTDNFEKAVQLLVERKQTLVIRFKGDNIVALKSSLDFDTDPIFPDAASVGRIADDGFTLGDRLLATYDDRTYLSEILAICNTVAHAISLKDKFEKSWEDRTSSAEKNKKETQALLRNVANANGGLLAPPPEPRSLFRALPQVPSLAAPSQTVPSAGVKTPGFPEMRADKEQNTAGKNPSDILPGFPEPSKEQPKERRHKKKRKRDTSSSSESDSDESSKRHKRKHRDSSKGREKKRRRKHKKDRKRRTPSFSSTSGSSNELLPKKSLAGNEYPYLVKTGKKRELAPYTGVFVDCSDLQVLVDRSKSKANLACNLATFLLGGEEGVRRFLSEEKPSERAGIAKMHPNLLKAIEHFVTKLKVTQCPGDVPKSFGQTIGSHFSKYRVQFRNMPVAEAEDAKELLP